MEHVYENVTVRVPRFSKAKNLRRKYNVESLLEILNNIDFDKINIPLYSYRNVLCNDDTRRGNRIVGYIDKYDRETDEFIVVIHEYFAGIISGFDNPIIYPRVQIMDENVTKILGFDICPKLYYSIIQ